MKPRFLLSVFLLLGVYPWSAWAQQAAEFFQQKCTGCHTIGGGRLIGPDLKDVAKHKDRAWLERFVVNPKALMDSGDPYALQLRQESRNLVMPTLPGVTPELAKALLDMIEEESELPRSRFAGTLSDRPLTPADLSAGTEFFLGTRRLSQGGAACISCHTLGNLQGMGGGRLGPDLTQVYERLGGRKALGAWLTTPGTTTMQAVFRQHPLQPEEILALVAVFEDAPKKSQSADSSSQINFFLAGMVGLCFGLAVMGWAWRGRFRTVRRALISNARGAE
ncbi:MAG: c-type cytochrome [Acidobacteria bacterium]|nr:c-type cytochrome [Acidobacteriota bacterium]